MSAPRVVSVNIGQIREVEWRGEVVTTGIWKSPVEGPIMLRGVNFIGDDQADRTVHGGPDKAVYAYGIEDYELWRRVGVDAMPGLFGENLTTEGIDLGAVISGERWTVGSTVLEVAQPRLPCYKLGIRMNDPRFPKKFQTAGRMGAYLRIVTEGAITAGDGIEVSARPAHGVTLDTMVAALHDERARVALRQVERLPVFWQQVADD